ncbi:MAG: hypothetical protein RL653_4548 [Pseudomonadota bacterium]|jgi:thiol-disulfide isomerase/thioredoxin
MAHSRPLVLALSLCAALPALADECAVSKSVNVHGPLRVGAPAPEFGGWLPSNELFSSARFMKERAGQAVVVSFFASWCKPCQKGLPVLQKLNDELKGRASVVLVAFGHDRDEVKAYLEGKDITLPVVLDTYKKQSQKFGVDTALPRTFVVDAGGKLVAAFECEGPDFAEQLKAAVTRATAAK